VIRDITRICENVAVSARIMPGLYELLDGKVSVNRLRKVEIEDLLRRDTIQTDINAVQALVRGKRVLITGGGGSIGSELCRQVLKCAPA
jgi:FlaA1/EpsC-like NDP-sugar epimerase